MPIRYCWALSFQSLAPSCSMRLKGSCRFLSCLFPQHRQLLLKAEVLVRVFDSVADDLVSRKGGGERGGRQEASNIRARQGCAVTTPCVSAAVESCFSSRLLVRYFRDSALVLNQLWCPHIVTSDELGMSVVIQVLRALARAELAPCVEAVVRISADRKRGFNQCTHNTLVSTVYWIDAKLERMFNPISEPRAAERRLSPAGSSNTPFTSMDPSSSIYQVYEELVKHRALCPRRTWKVLGFSRRLSNGGLGVADLRPRR